MTEHPDTPSPDEDPTLNRPTPPEDPGGKPDAPTINDAVKSIPLGGSPRAADQTPASDPDSIDQYRILGRIGSGGMGVVYRAEQANPKRVVALKVIRGSAVTENILRRFKLEAQILGRLRHPGIAQIYEAGVWDSSDGELPYFAMEYIPEARTLSQWVQHEQLGTQEILALITRICAAVQYAHQKGVIHRDLKPDNILVGKQGQFRIIDFGVARGTDPEVAQTTLETAVGALIGTVQYMAPEQCAGDPLAIDTRCDVYALGVILYELLCKKPPYDVRRKALQEALRIVQEDDPTALSSINRRLRGDVEVITLKALEKDPRHRYQSASDLANDIQAYLDGRPISAVPHSMAYHFKKFVRRNRTGVLAASLLFVIGIALLAAAWQWSRADAARQERNRMVAELIDFYMVEHFDAIARLAGSQPAREIIIERSLEYLETLRRDAQDDPDLQLILAEGLQAIGNNNWSMRMSSRGHLAEAIAAWESARHQLDQLAARDPSDERVAMAAIRVRTLLTDAYRRAGRDEAAAATAATAHDMLKGVPEPLASMAHARLHIDVLNDLAMTASTDAPEHLESAMAIARSAHETWPDHAMLERDVSILHNRLGDLARRDDRHDEALKHFEGALAIRQQRLAAEPESNSEQRDVMLSHRYIAQTLLQMDRADEAANRYATTIVPTARTLVERNTLEDGTVDMRSHRDLCIAQREHGDVLLMLGRLDDAARALATAHASNAAFMEAHPDDTLAVRDYGRCGASLAGALVELDRLDEAQEAIDAVRRRLTPDDGSPPNSDAAQVLAYCDALQEAMLSASEGP